MKWVSQAHSERSMVTSSSELGFNGTEGDVPKSNAVPSLLRVPVWRDYV